MLPAVASRSAKLSAPFEPIAIERPLAVTAPGEVRVVTPTAPFALVSVVVPPLVSALSEIPAFPLTTAFPPAVIGLLPVTYAPPPLTEMIPRSG